MEIEEVAENTYRIEIFDKRIDSLFAIYFINEGNGVLIEPGPASMIPHIQEALKQLGMTDLGFIIPTHIHIDHGGAIGSLSQLFPNAKVFVHPKATKHVIDPSRLIESTKMAFGDDFEDRYGPIIAVPESQMGIPHDEEVISINGRELQFFHAPGHAPHHIAILDRKTEGLFCGESLGVPRRGLEAIPLPTAAPPSFDMEEYLKTIEKLRQLRPKLLFYSHDGTGKNPEKLISTVAENTITVGNIILKSLKEEESVEAVNERLTEQICNRFNKDEADIIWTMTVHGYIHYFQKKGQA